MSRHLQRPDPHCDAAKREWGIPTYRLISSLISLLAYGRSHIARHVLNSAKCACLERKKISPDDANSNAVRRYGCCRPPPHTQWVRGGGRAIA